MNSVLFLPFFGEWFDFLSQLVILSNDSLDISPLLCFVVTSIPNCKSFICPFEYEWNNVFNVPNSTNRIFKNPFRRSLPFHPYSIPEH